MTASALKQKFIDFFVQKDHKQIANSSLIPENDPSALFISAGMHPLVPYLLGESHPAGKRLCNVQRCLRTDDIEHVGDGFHHTFFEMLGNWSLGDYWKEEAIEWSWEFLTKGLQIPPVKIFVSCFAGDQDAPKDEESAKIWQKLGVPQSRVYFLGKKENWWGPVGQTGPCGPDTEMFFDTGKPKCGLKCDVTCQCGKYIEIWNNVFMEYDRQTDGDYQPLKQKNVDTGMGVERVTAVLSGFEDDDYRIESFWPVIQKIEMVSGKKYEGINQMAMRIMVDHLRAAVFLTADGVLPSNIEQGYILRRLLRRAAIKLRLIDKELVPVTVLADVAQVIIQVYQTEYFTQKETKEKIIEVICEEMKKFGQTLDRGLRQVAKIDRFDAKKAFDLYQSYGFPLEITQEMAEQKGQEINQKEFAEEIKKHQQASRQGASKKFSGGLADHSATATKYHTATHLLHQALREVLGIHVRQVGCNITAARLRFDFVHPEKLTDEQINKVEKIVNQKIKENLPVKMVMMGVKEAKDQGALAFFDKRYDEQVKVFSAGDFSKEVCAGPHVTSTGKIGKIKIIKQKAVGAGRRRLYAVLAHGS